MLKATYDTTNSGIVDNAEKVNGLTVETAVPGALQGTDGADEDDVAACLVTQRWQAQAGDRQGADQVQQHTAVNLLRRKVFQRADVAASGIADHAAQHMRIQDELHDGNGRIEI